MSWTRFVAAGALCCALLSAQPSAAIAQLTEANVLLLYNSQNAESFAIYKAYIAARPGVLEYNLNMSYPLVTGSSQTSTPPTEEINNQFITPDKFEELFLDPGAFQTFLSNNPDILAIVTTRGLPAAVSTNFDPAAITTFDGISQSFEAALSAQSLTSRPNPYHRVREGFAEFMARCESGGPFGTDLGSMFLVSRLDGGTPVDAPTCSGVSLPNAIDAAEDLVARSSQLPPVNKYAVSVLIDLSPSGISQAAYPAGWATAAGRLWADGWVVLVESTERFLHGPNDPDFDPLLDAPFTEEYPTIALLTGGRNHGHLPGCISDPDCETVSRCYINYYLPHAAGALFSVESFNGFRLHSFQNDNSSQGDALNWIASSLGSFTVCHVTEPTAVEMRLSETLTSWLVDRRGWVESAFAGLITLGRMETVIGDPLASIVVYDPDLNNDRVINDDDLDIVDNNWHTSGPAGDITGDGYVDSEDRQVVLDAYGRDNTSPPSGAVFDEWTTPWEVFYSKSSARCRGDTNGDLVVNFDDINAISPLYNTTCPDDFLIADTNFDGQVSFLDLNVALGNFNEILGDFDNDDDIDVDDLDLLCDQMFTVDSNVWDCKLFPPPFTCDGWDERFDLNCDGLISCPDIEALQAAMSGSGECKACP